MPSRPRAIAPSHRCALAPLCPRAVASSSCRTVAPSSRRVVKPSRPCALVPSPSHCRTVASSSCRTVAPSSRRALAPWCLQVVAPSSHRTLVPQVVTLSRPHAVLFSHLHALALSPRRTLAPSHCCVVEPSRRGMHVVCCPRTRHIRLPAPRDARCAHSPSTSPSHLHRLGASHLAHFQCFPTLVSFSYARVVLVCPCTLFHVLWPPHIPCSLSLSRPLVLVVHVPHCVVLYCATWSCISGCLRPSPSLPCLLTIAAIHICLGVRALVSSCVPLLSML